MGGVDPNQLSELPQLYKQLMAKPLAPLNRGHLPDPHALYILYQSNEPVSVGSPPHLNEQELLTSSVRIGVRIEIGNVPMSDNRKRDEFAQRTKNVLQARWLSVSDPKQRLMFEVFVSQMLGVSVTHPRLINAIMKRAEQIAGAHPISG